MMFALLNEFQSVPIHYLPNLKSLLTQFTKNMVTQNKFKPKF